MLVASWRMDRLESLNINPWSAPGLMPGVLGALMLIFGLALALRRAPATPAAPGSWRRTLLALLLCTAFAGGFLGRGLPFWLTAGAFLFAAMFAFRRLDEPAPTARLALSSAGIAVAAAAVIHFLFQEVFLVRLP